VVLPTALIEAIDALVTPRRRSEFLAEAAAEKLARLRRQEQRRVQARSASAVPPGAELLPREVDASAAPEGSAGERAGNDDSAGSGDSARQRFDAIWGR